MYASYVCNVHKNTLQCLNSPHFAFGSLCTGIRCCCCSVPFIHFSAHYFPLKKIRFVSWKYRKRIVIPILLTSLSNYHFSLNWKSFFFHICGKVDFAAICCWLNYFNLRREYNAVPEKWFIKNIKRNEEKQVNKNDVDEQKTTDCLFAGCRCCNQLYWFVV